MPVTGGAVRGFCGALIVGAIILVDPVSYGLAADQSGGSPVVEPGDNVGASGEAAKARGRVLWKRQPGTNEFEEGNGIATDRHGNVYVVGTTVGALGGPNKGSVDAWVIKFDGDGNVLWRLQPGTSESDFANGVATDQAGNVYVVGQINFLQGADSDASVIKFDGNGHELWNQRLGTEAEDLAAGVATDRDGNVYVVGGTQGALFGPNNLQFDAWIAKFDKDGNVLWTRQPRTEWDDIANAVATDKQGNVYVVGQTDGSLAGPNPSEGVRDAWIIKFNAGGRELWRRQFSTGAFDSAKGVATDKDGNAYVVGQIFLADPGLGAWVVKYGSNGTQLWERQPGTTSNDSANGVATDRDGKVYVVGRTIFAPEATLPDHDAFVAAFNRRGDLLWNQGPRTTSFDEANGVATDKHGDIYVVGSTGGALGGANKGFGDAWVMKFKGGKHERR